jgi:NAD(P)-binding Rossmann-like domain
MRQNISGDVMVISKDQDSVTLPAPAIPINLKYRIKGEPAIIDRDYALLIVACDPRNLTNICDYTPAELDIFAKLVDFTFHTSLIKVKVASPQLHAVHFAPHTLERMTGGVYAFRNESAKQFGLEVANTMTHNLVTVYQLVGSTAAPWSAEKFEEILARQLPEISWWPFGDDYEVLDTVTTPYFDHFNSEDLQAGLPWQLLNLQGQHQTLYAHAFTCFESALHCWGYANLLLKQNGVKQVLPQDLDAPIAILGAGVSGLLFALKLKRLGYKNINILESTERSGGKTHTIIKDGPYPSGSTEPTVCELGTCYLSPAYAPMLADLEEFLIDNSQVDFAGNDPNFRGIVTAEIFPPTFEVEPIINYADYVVLKAKALLELPQDYESTLIQLRIAFDLTKYCILHWEHMGQQRPMPLQPPAALLDRTLYQFLADHDLLSLVGLMEYIYEVQGYGTLTSIPAYYGLIWIPPIVIQTILFDNLHLDNKPVVTAWKNGWGDLWNQIVTKEDLQITYLAETISIQRSAN